MIPMAALRGRGTWPPSGRRPAEAVPAAVRCRSTPPLGRGAGTRRPGAAWCGPRTPGYVLRSRSPPWRLAVVVVGAVPMAAASTNPNAAPILCQALDGTPTRRHARSRRSRLIDQDGPAGVSGQPAGQGGGAHLPRSGVHVGLPADRPGVPPGGRACSEPDATAVVFVAVVANPIYRAAPSPRRSTARRVSPTCPIGSTSPGRLSGLDQVWAPTGSRRPSCRPGRWSPTASWPIVIDARKVTPARSSVAEPGKGAASVVVVLGVPGVPLSTTSSTREGGPAPVARRSTWTALVAGGDGRRPRRLLDHDDRLDADAPCPTVDQRRLDATIDTGSGEVAVARHGQPQRPAQHVLAGTGAGGRRGTWQVVTPPGVADNGGLVVSAGAGSSGLLAGIEPSQALLYSPTVAERRRRPVVVPGSSFQGGLAAVPDALAVGRRFDRGGPRPQRSG